MDRQFFDDIVSLEKSKEFLDSLLDEIKANFGEIHLAMISIIMGWASSNLREANPDLTAFNFR